jgi:uncharacterized protein
LTTAEFLQIALANPANGGLLRRLRPLQLPQCHLTAGCLFQAVWNRTSGRSPDWGIKDYDVFYFDDRDLSPAAEEAVIRRVQEAAADLGIEVEVRNQARVHLWYPEHFKHDYSPLHTAREGIDRFLVACTCVGIEADSGEVYAPNGLLDLASGALRTNPLCPSPELFRAKARSYQVRWPWLTVLD